MPSQQTMRSAMTINICSIIKSFLSLFHITMLSRITGEQNGSAAASLMNVRAKACMLVCAAVLLAGRNAIAQAAGGIIVEKADKVGEGERAGIQAGDIILKWNRNGKAQGKIESPWELLEIEAEQAPLGDITIEGRRGAERKLWVLGKGYWGIEARPNLTDELLPIYLKAREMEKVSKLVDAAAQWQVAASLPEVNNTQIEVWLLWQAVRSLDNAERGPEADALFHNILKKAALIGPRAVAQLMQSRADGFRLQSNFGNAEKYYQESIKEFSKLGMESLQIAAIFDQLGVISWKQGDLSKADIYLRQSISINKKLAPWSLAFVRSLRHLGSVCRPGGNLSQAEDCMNQILTTEKDHDKGSLANTSSNLGVVARQRGDLLKAEKIYRELLAIKKVWLPDSLSLAASLTNLGIVAHMHGDLSQAEEYLQRALQITQRLAPKSVNHAAVLTSLGTIAFDRGDLVRSEKYHRRSLLLNQQLAPESLDIAASLINLGRISRQKGNLVQAKDYFQQALAIDSKFAPRSLDTAETLMLLGDIARDHNNWTDAEIYYRQALSIASDRASGSTLHAELLAGLASVMRHKQQLNTAQQLYERALVALEFQIAHFGGTGDLRADFRSKHAEFYNNYIELLLMLGQQEHALETLERFRAQSLLELLNGLRLNSVEGVEPDLLKQERSLREQMSFKSTQQMRLLGNKHTESQAATIKEEIDNLLVRYHDIQGEILNTAPAYAALTQPHSLNIKQIQQLLEPDTLLLEYSLGKQRSHVWVLTSISVSCYKLPQRTTVESLARTIYAGVASNNYRMPHREELHGRLYLAKTKRRYGQAMTTLGRILWQPMAKSELDKKRWLIVADGALQYIPFNILPLPDKSLPILSHEIVHLPSASVLSVLRRQNLDRKKNPRLVAILADPVFDKDDPRVDAASAHQKLMGVSQQHQQNEQFLRDMSSERLGRSIADMGPAVNSRATLARLPFSRRESRAIIAASPDGQAIEVLDFDANWTFVTSGDLAQYRIVHFATHGLLNNEHPELSGLVLSLVDAQGKAQTGFLELQDIYNLRLPVDLVVLSACETGLGKQVQGEGLIGLARGFMHAGATRVIASLWKVDDSATAELMGHFYQGIFHDRLSPAAALRKAQIRMMRQKRWADPYYWAAFQIQGEWK